MCVCVGEGGDERAIESATLTKVLDQLLQVLTSNPAI